MYRFLNLFIFFSINLSYLSYSQDFDSLAIDTFLTDYERSFEDSISSINENNKLFVESRKLYNSGIEAFQNQNFDSAITVFTKVILIDSTFSKAFFYRGKCYEYTDRKKIAIKDYQLSFKLDSSNFEPLYSIANIRSSFDINAALIIYDKILLLNQNESLAHYKKGIIFYLQKKVDDAIESFTNSINLIDDAMVYNDRASCFRLEEKHDLAINDYLKSISLNPDLAFVYIELVVTLEIAYSCSAATATTG